MTREEKARAYDEALERASKIRNGEDNWRFCDLTEITPALEEVFPELAESEEERMMREFNDWLCEEIECLTNDLRDEEDRRTLNMLCYVLTKVKDWLEKQKEQKPAESISQPTVQGKGVYKICPRCKERMVRDDSMVYTSMPPQYRYECPKCGESECDTVMYDNPEMEKQKPAEVDESTKRLNDNWMKQHFDDYKERKPAEWSEKHIADIFEKVGLSKIVREQGNDELTNAVQSAMIELSKVGNTEWSEEDEVMLKGCIRSIEEARDKRYPNECDTNISYNREINWLKSLPLNLKKKNDDVAKLCSNEWNKEDEIMLKWIEDILLIADDDLSDKLNGRVSPITDSAYSSMKLCIAKCLSWLKSLKPSWKPSEVCYGPKGDPDPAGVWKPSDEQMEELRGTIAYMTVHNMNVDSLVSLYEQLKKL